MNDQVIWLIALIPIVVFVICCVYIFTAEIEARKKRQETDEMTSHNVEVDELPALTQVSATVIDMHCSVKLVGMKSPKSTKVYAVFFQTKEGILTFEVPEEMYDGFEVGQSGQLTFVDDNLYGFMLEEDTSE